MNENPAGATLPGGSSMPPPRPSKVIRVVIAPRVPRRGFGICPGCFGVGEYVLDDSDAEIHLLGVPLYLLQCLLHLDDRGSIGHRITPVIHLVFNVIEFFTDTAQVVSKVVDSLGALLVLGLYRERGG